MVRIITMFTGNILRGGSFDFLYKINSQGDILWNNEYQYFGFAYTVRGLMHLKDKSVLTVGGVQNHRY